MVSAPLPAGHSPAVAPEAVSLLAAVMASRRVQTPSSATTLVVLSTVIVAAWATGTFRADRLTRLSTAPIMHSATSINRTRISKAFAFLFFILLPRCSSE